ncbi:PUMP1 [Symbiodinium natans]|uniref:PUMP1 protein n=1 Tax=Symbiodinium natans TaxID=878477 RepID=A0A812LJE8_9DINO|nr:PUMP1 [Symbiodinium natans]
MAFLGDVAAAGLGAAVTDTIFNPLAMITVRLQVDKDKVLYRDLRQCALRIFQEEGLLGLWLPGLVATWMRAFTQTGLRLGLYPSIKRLYQSAGLGDDNLAVKICSGATTGSLGAAIANPVDLIRVRLQGEAGLLRNGVYATGLRAGHPPRHAHTPRAFVDIFQQEGLGGLWRGVSANVARASLLSSAQLTTYDQCKQMAVHAGWLDGPKLHLASSCLSGFVAQIACMPADVVKTRVQCGQGVFRHPLHCAACILREEGPRGFYRGFAPAAARQVPVMAVQMPIVEQIRKRLFGLDYM